MTDKPTPKQRQIAAELSRMLYGTDDRTVEELAQCHPVHVSGDIVAGMCGYATYDEVPAKFCDAVGVAGYDTDIAIACGNRTVIVGRDFQPTGVS